jgi:hypothetical protein
MRGTTHLEEAPAMEGLGGELGFWLAAGAVVVALILRTWLRERDKQALLLEMLKADAGGKITEVLAYLREKDAADRQLQRELSGVDWWNNRDWPRIRRAAAAFAVAVAAFPAGLMAGYLVSEEGRMAPVPFGVMAAVWVAGGVIAWLIVRSSRTAKNDSRPVA